METAARLGFVARGITYIVVGVIGVMLALGIARHEPERAGALEAIATKPLGYLLLWILVIGFGALAVWRLVQAASGRAYRSGRDRLFALGAGIGYAIIFFSTLMFVVHGRAPASGDATARDLTARILSLSGGRVILVLIGLAIAAAGIVTTLRGLRIEFVEDLRMGWMRRSTQDMVVLLGRVGYIARGLVVIGIGIAALYAAADYNPADAKGVDGVLREFAQTVFGPWLLILVALGLVAFGVFSFLEARWRRTYGGIPV
ncbi:DUF1206 domain-containing protein [Nocardia alni]|uniref:DUF1206 domain-containing protein n=1 Tax=Nocardia alni TaxID=2815723 RepID=UPI0020B1C573|nr:DUF1206 domain-containing protein [Nocardia alni]